MAEVLKAALPYERDSYFSNPLLKSSPSSQSSFVVGSPPYSHTPPIKSHHQEQYPPQAASDESSPPDTPPSYSTSLSPTSSFPSTIPSSISLDRRKSFDEDIDFPCYDSADYLNGDDHVRPYIDESYAEAPSAENSPSPFLGSEASSPGLRPVADDTAVRSEPSQQVDYLSHDWREEDIWSSWKHIVSKRHIYGETSRLENASWRTWTKSKYKLRTVSPETLNWLKDCDVTWLYGPLQQAPSGQSTSEPVSRMSKTNSFLNKKPILKKRNISEVMLQKSLSASSLVRQAAAAVQAQRGLDSPDYSRQGAPVVGRIPSDLSTPLNGPIYGLDGIDTASHLPSESSSGLRTPDTIAKKHISFNEKVEQCIAVDFKLQEQEEEDVSWVSPIDDSSEDELVMRPSTRKLSSNNNSRRNSFTQEGKTIQLLAPTTLKYHGPDAVPIPPTPGWQPGRLATSASQETLRPRRPSANFLLDEDEDDTDMSWEPAGAFNYSHQDGPSSIQERSIQADGEDGPYKGMRRTASGMFMPFDGDEDNDVAASGILGRFVDTVNTARDIAHVIWNVGWRQ